MITVEQMVQREVLCCMSSLVSTLAGGYGTAALNGDLEDLTEQAFELAQPIPDYEEAATQEGWTGPHPSGGTYFEDKTDGQTWSAGSWEELCHAFDIEPYEWEVYEHWAVSAWLAEKLIAAGERVDTDFAGFNVWARTCSGQGIACDGVIRGIHADMVKD